MKMTDEIELHPAGRTRGRKASLLLALLAAGIGVALVVGLGVYLSGRDAEALKRFPDQVEVLSSGWGPGPPGVVKLKLRLSRKDGRSFDPRSGAALLDPTPGGGRFHYVRGWTDLHASRPTQQVDMDFQQAVELPKKPEGPLRLEIRGWTQPRIHAPWLQRLKALMGAPSILQVTVPLYPLVNGEVLLPPPGSPGLDQD